MAEKHTYEQILKSSAMIGGSSVLKIAIGVVRTKAMAILLGPAGVGLLGLYGSILELAVSIAGLGINSSGVRQIAEAAGSNDADRIARTAVVLRRISVFLGLLGAALLIAFSGIVSALTFGNDRYAAAIALLSIAVFFNLVSAGQGALLQGMRRISDMAKMGIWGSLFGALISVTTVYFLREEGLVPSLILLAVMSLVTSWWYSRKIRLQTPSLSATQLGQEASAMLKLGFAFMASALLMSGAAYAVRLIIVRKVGFDAAGLYQAAWGLGGLYLGFILQAMGADFYPRLTAIVRDNAECNRVVNEQAHISLLLAGPGVIATLAFAPLVIALFYTSKFEGAVEVLRWLCLGMALRVISWPMGFIIVAKNVSKIFIFCELVWTIVYLGLAWTNVNYFGLKGAGIAFFGSYIFHVFMTYLIVRRLSGFRWTRANLQLVFLSFVLMAIVFCGYYVLPPWPAAGAGALAVLLSGVYSVRVLLRLVPPSRMPRLVRKLLEGFRLIPANADAHPGLKPIISRAAARGRGAGNKPSIIIKRLILALIICAVVSVGAREFGETYGWQEMLSYLSSKTGTFLSLLPGR